MVVEAYERTLFDLPIAHRDDPLSSYKAADRMLKTSRLKNQTRAVYEALRRNPVCTSAELAVLMAVDRHMPARRLANLQRQGLVMKGKLRMRRACHSVCLTWWPRDEMT